MRGSIHKRKKGTYAVVIDRGMKVSKKTGKLRRYQQWTIVHGTLEDAEKKLTELLGEIDNGTYVKPSETTLIEWLRLDLEEQVKPNLRPETHRTYSSLVQQHVAKAPVGSITLQELRNRELERFYAGLELAPSSVTVLHAMIHNALRRAVKQKLIKVNPADDVERKKPAKGASAVTAKLHCWSADEARRVLAKAKTASPQLRAYVYLALDSGARKSELNGLTWSDINLDSGELTISRQLDKASDPPVWGPTKTAEPRTFHVGPETVAQLRAHKKAQAELKMRNRAVYSDFGLIFAKEPEHLVRRTAKPGQAIESLSEAPFQKLAKSAGVRRIKFHGVRHTTATLSLLAGEPWHVVAARLGHTVEVLMKTYAHATPDAQKAAAARLGKVLHG